MYTQRFAFLGALAMVALVGCETATEPEADAGPVTSEEDVFDIPIPSGVFGSSIVDRNPNGATGNLHTSGLTPGNAYTMWMIVFNNPAACAEVPCLEPDLATTDVAGDVIYVTGHVAVDDAETFSGQVAKGDTSQSLFFNSFGLPTLGLTNLLGAQITLVVRDHGPAIPGQMPGQIHTYEGACTAGSSFDLGVGGFECADILASIHIP